MHPLLSVTLVVASASPSSPPSSAPVWVDLVGIQLAHYQRETDSKARAVLLKQLAPTRDPRVAVALGEALTDHALPVRVSATYGLLDHYLPAVVEGGTEQHMEAAARWWKANEARLRRAAVRPSPRSAP